jgi:flagellar hook-basal body complex protein FliE
VTSSLFSAFNPIGSVSMNPINSPFRLDSMDSLSGAKLAPAFQPEIDTDNRASFQNVLGNAISGVNETMAAPDVLMHQAMTTGGVDVHDVMVANAKAELAINVTTQIATKVIQAYDRLLQIQI